MTSYYAENLSGRRLERCYAVASSRIKQYLEAEILHCLEEIRPKDVVLELGCGYGRLARRIARVARRVVGIDTALESLVLGSRQLAPGTPCEFVQMDALDLGFSDSSFDAVLCVQNGICAFGVHQPTMLREALRVTREGGLLLFSTYSDAIWPDRLAWFEAQAAEGLVGPIDHAASGDGVIVCQDGFRASRLTTRDFNDLCSEVGVTATTVEVDESSLFCRIVRR